MLKGDVKLQLTNLWFQLRPVTDTQRALSTNYDVGYRGNEPPSTTSQRASYSVSATLPAGVSPAFGAPASGHVTTTLERDTKPPSKGSKPMTATQLAAGVDGDHHEKEKKHKSRFSFFGSKSKKDKEGKK